MHDFILHLKLNKKKLLKICSRIISPYCDASNLFTIESEWKTTFST